MTSAMLANFVQAGWGALPSVRPPRDRERARAPCLPLCPSRRIRRETKEEETTAKFHAHGGAFENGRGCGTHTATASFSVPPPGQLGLPACDDAASVSHANL